MCSPWKTGETLIQREETRSVEGLVKSESDRRESEAQRLETVFKSTTNTFYLVCFTAVVVSSSSPGPGPGPGPGVQGPDEIQLLQFQGRQTVGARLFEGFSVICPPAVFISAARQTDFNGFLWTLCQIIFFKAL